MDPDKVSDALYECETAIQNYTDRISSHLEGRETKRKDGETVLVRTLVGFIHGTRPITDCAIYDRKKSY